MRLCLKLGGIKERTSGRGTAGGPTAVLRADGEALRLADVALVCEILRRGEDMWDLIELPGCGGREFGRCWGESVDAGGLCCLFRRRWCFEPPGQARVFGGTWQRTGARLTEAFMRGLQTSSFPPQTPAFYSNLRQPDTLPTRLATPMTAQKTPSLF